MALTPTAWLISYDISSNAQRARAATALAGYGRRVLLSVFEVPGGWQRGAQAAAAAEALLDEGDSLLVVPLCPRCRRSQHGEVVEPAARERCW